MSPIEAVAIAFALAVVGLWLGYRLFKMHPHAEDEPYVPAQSKETDE